jgi:hypothetical protein
MLRVLSLKMRKLEKWQETRKTNSNSKGEVPLEATQLANNLEANRMLQILVYNSMDSQGRSHKDSLQKLSRNAKKFSKVY